jgi:hypothetical protein
MADVQNTQKLASIYTVIRQRMDLIVVEHEFFEGCKFFKGKIFEVGNIIKRKVEFLHAGETQRTIFYKLCWDGIEITAAVVERINA